MKKTLIFMMAILLIVLMVSCNSDVGTSGSDNLVEVKIAGEGNSKSLSTEFSSEVPAVSELVWFYKAVKADTGLYATGQQKDWTAVKNSSNGYQVGLENTSLGQFSAGAWIFSFKGVKNDEYIGTNSEVVVYECASLSQTVDSTTAVYENNTTVYLTIPLTLGSGVNKAKVVFTNLSFTLPSSANLNKNYSGTFSLTISGNGSENNIVSSSASVNNGVVTFTLPETNYYEYSSAGSHTYTFTVKLGDSDVASLPSYPVSVSLGTTASVSGSIEEYANTTYYVVAKTITGEKVTVSNSSESVTGSTTDTMTFAVANTPDSVATGNTSSTTIEFTNGYSEASPGDSYYIAQETYGAEAAGNFIVTAGENSTNAVAGIDLDLYKVVEQGEDEKQTVTNQTVQVTTTIATGLTDVAVNGASDGNPANGVTLNSYNSATGVLVFTTTHFSQFLVTSSNEAINVTTNVAYDTIQNAVNSVGNDETIKLLKNVTVSSVTMNNSKKYIFDLSGKTLTGNTAPNGDMIVVSNSTDVKFINGTIICGNLLGSTTDNSLPWDAIWLYGSNTTVTIENVDLTANCKQGIIISSTGNIGGRFIMSSGSVTNIGAVSGKGCSGIQVQENGQIIINGGTISGTSYGITGNGTQPGTSITINDGAIKATGEGGTGIYHPQNGNLTIQGGSVTAAASAIEVRSGILTVDGGIFRQTLTPTGSTPNGSGTTTVGAALGIAQHTTTNPITVNINGGTFEGFTALYESNPQNNAFTDSNKITISITGGVFNSINQGTASIMVNDYEAPNSFSISGATCNGTVSPSQQ